LTLATKLLGWGRQKGAKHGYPKLAKQSKTPKGVTSSVESTGTTQHKFLKKDDHSPLRDQHGNSYGFTIPDNILNHPDWKSPENISKEIELKRRQIENIDNAISQFNQRKKDNVNDKYQHHNEPDAIKEYAYYNKRIKELQKERADIKGQILLLEFNQS